MSRQQALLLVTVLALLGPSCSLRERGITFDADVVHYKQLADATEYRDVAQMTAEVPAALSPRTIQDTSEPDNWWDMSLAEAIQLALDKSPVMRDLGGASVRSPATVRTVHQPSIDASDPRYGMEAGLSEFDATVHSQLSYQHNRRWMNNFLSSGGVSPLEGLKQDYAESLTELTKYAATGTTMTLRGIVDYDYNNQAANKFPYTYDSYAEAEVRQHVLRYAGLDYNRIAGGGSVSGTSAIVYNGIMVARLNTDVSLIDFRIGVRDVVSNVENAYWDLYFSYRDLHAKIEARNRCLETWRAIYGMMQAGQPGGEAEREAQFRGQYYRFEEDVKNALTGQLLDRTTTFNGSSGGTFRGVSGVQVAERRLRLVLGLDISDARLIRPADEPTLARVEFDWQQLVAESVTRREELHRQRLAVRRRELEATASRNILLPQFDVFARVRVRGSGENWATGADPAKIASDDPAFLKDSSLANLFAGDFKEYMVGGEFSYALGARKGHAAVRNAQLQLAREHAVLQEQERQIIHDLSNAYADAQRAFEIVQTNYNGRLAAKTQVDLLRDKLAGRLAVNLDQLIDAERRFSETESQYHRALAEYMIALKNVHFEKGTLLEYSHVELAEAHDAALCSLLSARRTDMPSRAELLDYRLSRPLARRAGVDPDQPAAAQGAAGEPADSLPPPADRAAPPTDSAAPPADSAAPPADSAAPPADSAAPPADMAAPPADMAAPPADSVAPPADKAAPPTDSVAPSADKAAPPADSAAPPTDSAAPPADKAAPPADPVLAPQGNQNPGGPSEMTPPPATPADPSQATAPEPSVGAPVSPLLIDSFEGSAAATPNVSGTTDRQSEERIPEGPAQTPMASTAVRSLVGRLFVPKESLSTAAEPAPQQGEATAAQPPATRKAGWRLNDASAETVRPQELPADRNVRAGQGEPPLVTAADPTFFDGSAGESSSGATTAAQSRAARKAGWRLNDSPAKTAERWPQGYR